MPDPNRPLSEGKIAALKRLKLAYDDALDAGEEPAQFAATKDDLIAEGATSNDLLWLIKLHYVEHVRELASDGERRRQFRAATTPALTHASCFFLSYGGNVYVEGNGLSRRTASGGSTSSRRPQANRRSGAASNRRRKRPKERGSGRIASLRASRRRSTPREREVPAWNAVEGNLYWCGQAIMHLAPHASAERELLDQFEAWGWESPISNPIPRGTTGDATQARRHAVYHLNRRLGKNSPVRFFCLDGDLIGWRERSSRSKQT